MIQMPMRLQSHLIQIKSIKIQIRIQTKTRIKIRILKLKKAPILEILIMSLTG